MIKRLMDRFTTRPEPRQLAPVSKWERADQMVEDGSWDQGHRPLGWTAEDEREYTA